MFKTIVTIKDGSIHESTNEDESTNESTHESTHKDNIPEIGYDPESILIKDKYINIKRNTEIYKYRESDILDYNESPHLNLHQKKSIRDMENLERHNISIFTYNKDKQVSIANRLAVKTKFGILSNLPGTGKTRIAIMLALRNKYHANFSNVEDEESKESKKFVLDEAVESFIIEQTRKKVLKEIILEEVDRYYDNELDYTRIYNGTKHNFIVCIKRCVFVDNMKLCLRLNGMPDDGINYPTNYFDEFVKNINFKKHVKEYRQQFKNYSNKPFRYYQPDLEFFLEDMSSKYKFDKVRNIYKFPIDTLKRKNRASNKHELLKTVYFNNIKDSLVYLDATLIAVPVSTYTQWIKEIEVFDIADEYSILYITTKSNKNIEKLYSNEYDIILVTNTFYNKYIENVMFNRIIFDEPDTVNYVDNKSVFYRFKWLLSSSINNLKYTPNEIFEEAPNNILNSYGIKDSSNKQDSYGIEHKPSDRTITKVGDTEFDTIMDVDKSVYSDQRLFTNLHNKLNIYHESEINNASKFTFLLYTNFVDTKFMSDYSGFINKQNIKNATESITSGIGEAYTRLFNTPYRCAFDALYIPLIEKIKKCTDIDTIKELKEELLELDKKVIHTMNHKDACMICLSDIEAENAILLNCCPWLLCTDTCFPELKIRSYHDRDDRVFCTICKRFAYPFDIKDTVFYNRLMLYNEEVNILDKTREYSKDKGLLKIDMRRTRFSEIKKIVLDKTSIKKIILYSTNNNSNINNILLDDIDKLNIKYHILKGSSDTRTETIREWKEENDKTTILILLSHSNIAGLNLSEATDIIVYNHIETPILLQLVGRVDRHELEPHRNVNIHLLYSDEITIPERYASSNISFVNIESTSSF